MCAFSVRSLGSIALRKAEDADFKYHFDVFSVNFNEELVALYGGSLQRQTRFVHECIKVILKLYKGFAPRSVAIVELLNVLVTQATPHIAPFFSPLEDFYRAVNQKWIQKAKEIKNLTTLSVAGGFRDYQVRTGLAFLPRTSHQSSALCVVTSAIPRVWASTDHLSIVWCKELILATIRAFFDLIDENTKQITEDPQKRMLVLNHHFLRHPAKLYEESPESVAELTGEVNWIQIKTSKWSYTVYNESDGKYFTFPLSSHRKPYSHVYCQSSMLDTNSWIYGCINSSSPVCLRGVDLSWKTELLPTVKTVTLKLQEYPSLSHLVLHVPAVNGNKFTFDCEFFNEASRTVQLPVTHLFSFGRPPSLCLALCFIMYFHLLLSERKPSVYQLHIPWSYEDSLTLSQVPSSTEISAKLHIAQPENDTAVPSLNIYSSSDCKYEVTVKTSFLQVLGQVIRFHGGTLPVYIISNILLAYGRQLRSLISTGHCTDFVPALTKAARPYKVEPIVNIVKFLLGLNWLKGIWDILSLPELDVVTPNNQNLLFPFVSLILFMFGTGIAYWCGKLFSSFLRISSSLHVALARPSRLPPEPSLITRRTLCVAVCMFFLSWTTCGALAILMTYAHYTFKVFNQPVANTVSTTSSPPTGSAAVDSVVDSLKMHVTVLNLLTLIVLLSCPSFIYWLKNLRHHIKLDPDPCRSTAFMLIAILGILMNASTTKVKTSKLLKMAAHLPLPLSVAAVVFAPMHLDRMPYFVIIPLFLHALCLKTMLGTCCEG
uniref:Post-GPI attachment to proteins inositol deacylase 1 n=1 Tax=Podarcis muralis TaxID=64176 RepID=A0A670IBN9_PODMU